MDAEIAPKKDKLESWKEIAAYLNRDVRTARRWEKVRGLPIRRFPGTRGGVYALVTEIDDWLNNGASRGSDTQMAEPVPPSALAKRITLGWSSMAAVSVIALALAVVFLAPASPQVRAHAEFTHNGWVKSALLRRGGALFYQAKDPRSGMSEAIRRISESGDQLLAELPPGPGVRLLDVSVNRSRILFGRQVAGECDSELWEMPFAAGQPHRIGQACATAAAWSPDGARLAYNEGRALYLANPDGSAPQKLARLPFAKATELRWSLDGRRIRLILPESEGEHQHGRLWDVQVEHRSAAPVLPGWSREDTDDERGGQWTTDGRFFVFAATHNGTDGIWAIREYSSIFGRWRPQPILLTLVAKYADSVTVGSGRNKLFALVVRPRRGELLRLDSKTLQFTLDPDWSWLSGGQLAFSPDGRRVAYLSYPEHGLFVADIDGRNSYPLTHGADRGALPQWSPDGQRLAFMGWQPGAGGVTRIRIVSPGGQDPIVPAPVRNWQGAPYWISDTQLVFGDSGPNLPMPPTCSLHVFNLKTDKTTDLPGTSGLWTARPSPTGRYIAAQNNDKSKLMLYDRRTTALTEVFRSPEGTLGDNPTWSRDGAYLYMDVPYAKNPAIYRIRIADRKIERVASLAGIQRVVEGIGLWMGFAPDNSLLILRQVEGSEIDSWDWVAP